MTPRPFQLRIEDDAIVDLHERLQRTRFPDQAPGAAWAYGTDLVWLRELVGYWHDRFDWRAQEARLRLAFACDPKLVLATRGLPTPWSQAPERC